MKEIVVIGTTFLPTVSWVREKRDMLDHESGGMFDPTRDLISTASVHHKMGGRRPDKIYVLDFEEWQPRSVVRAKDIFADLPDTEIHYITTKSISWDSRLARK